MESAGQEAIEIVFSLPPRIDQAGHAQECQMMAHGRLALAQEIAERANVQFIGLKQKVDDPQARRVGKHFEQTDQFSRHTVGEHFR